MFSIKICGITNRPDAVHAADAGADAVGLNFYSGSPRYISPESARDIVAPLPSHVARVGVFVNASAQQIAKVAHVVPLDWIQLHGDEPWQLVQELTDWLILRAVRLRGQSLPALAKHLLLSGADAVLVDAFQEGRYGGTGQAANWQAAADLRPLLNGLPLVLAGGLRADNLSQAIQATHPDAVDTASGVEESPTQKDPAAVTAFVEAARTAFGTSGQ